MTRKEAIKILQDYPKCTVGQLSEVPVKAVLEFMEAIPHWISVEDELPKEKGAYLFHFVDGQTRVEGYFPELHLSKCVTHWMPLPEAPRKEDKK